MTTKNVQANNQNGIAEKPYKITLEKVAKGYVRWKVHADSIGQALDDWCKVKQSLKEMGEMIEGEEPDIQEQE